MPSLAPKVEEKKAKQSKFHACDLCKLPLVLVVVVFISSHMHM